MSDQSLSSYDRAGVQLRDDRQLIDSPGLCRFCSNPLQESFCDLGEVPLSNSFLTADQLHLPEPTYPLHAYVCSQCFLVQVGEFQSPPEIFRDYLYFSSMSDSWLEHAKAYVDLVVSRFHLDGSSFIVEIGSNDGYLLKNFVDKGFSVLGIEPAENVAEVAVRKGVPTVARFFSTVTAKELVDAGKLADLLLGNNVLAHVPDINDFVLGLATLLKPGGVITMEFPHLLRLTEGNQFDTIYHEHFSYFSFFTVDQIFRRHRLVIFDVEQLPTHGGSLRIYARHSSHATPALSESVGVVRRQELQAGLDTLAPYRAFSARVKKIRQQLVHFLLSVKTSGRLVVGYGAPAKSNTLLNYSGIDASLLPYTVDRSPYKQNRFLPGSHIPIYHPDRLRADRPDYVLLLPWNLRDELVAQLSFIRAWGGKFVVPIPGLEVFA